MDTTSQIWTGIAYIVVVGVYAFFFYYLAFQSNPINRRKKIWRFFGPALNAALREEDSPDRQLDRLLRWFASTRRLQGEAARSVADIYELIADASWYVQSTAPRKFKERFTVSVSDDLTRRILALQEYIDENRPFRDLPDQQRIPLT